MVHYTARNGYDQLVRTTHPTLDDALDQVAADLASGLTPVILHGGARPAADGASLIALVQARPARSLPRLRRRRNARP